MFVNVNMVLTCIGLVVELFVFPMDNVWKNIIVLAHTNFIKYLVKNLVHMEILVFVFAIMVINKMTMNVIVHLIKKKSGIPVIPDISVWSDHNLLYQS